MRDIGEYVEQRMMISLCVAVKKSQKEKSEKPFMTACTPYPKCEDICVAAWGYARGKPVGNW
jgi:hypothetical protein